MKNDIRSFLISIDRMTADFTDKSDAAWRGTCSTFSENVKAGGQFGPGTPVDFGFARNSWVDGINGEGEYHQPSQPTSTQLQLVRKGGKPSLASPAPFDFGQLKLGDTYFLTSNCVYMRALDYGHSQQAPTGMMRLVLAALPQIAAQEAQAVR